MKLAMIYDPKCPKMTEDHYSRTYLEMFQAVVARFGTVQHITESCSAKDIEADVIIIWDIHSAHHIEIDGLIDHKAVKYTYFNDPYQKGLEGVYEENKVYVRKLGAKTRTERALKRGVNFIICPYTGLYYEHIAPHLGKDAEDMLFWFPPAPSVSRFPDRHRPLKDRLHKILANGTTWGGNGAYEFRDWVYAQKNAFYKQHSARNPEIPKAGDYGNFLSKYAGAFALCDTRIVPKYLEIPLAGCVCFAQDQEDYRKMGFVDCKNYIRLDVGDFQKLTNHFLLSDPKTYQFIADAGRKLIEENWTAEHFADALYNHAKSKGA